MSEKISKLGMVWLVLLCIEVAVMLVLNVVSEASLMMRLVGIIAYGGTLVSLIFLIRGRGIKYFISYTICFVISYLLLMIPDLVRFNEFDLENIPSLILVVVNILLTYWATKGTFLKENS